MRHKTHLIGLIGISCTSLCMLGIPLLATLLAALGLPNFLSEKLMMGMLLMFLVMFGTGTYSAFRHHHQLAPGVLAGLGTVILISASAMVVPMKAGWAALALFAAAWIWDAKLMRSCRTEEGAR